MKLIHMLAAVAALFPIVSLADSAYAQSGLMHDGCTADQVFTAGDLTISGAFTRAMLPQAKTGGGYMSITNSGSQPDRLMGAQSEVARLAQLHLMQMEGEVMKMAEVAGGVEIPAGETVTLVPGGLHVMLLGVEVPFKEGECLELTLKFEHAGDVPVVLSVGSAAAAAAPALH